MRHAFVRLAALSAGAVMAGGLLIAAADAPEIEPTPSVEAVETTEADAAAALDNAGDADTIGEVQEVAPATPQAEGEVSELTPPAEVPSDAPACAEGWTLAEDGTCVPPGYYAEPLPVIHEDDPRWDCRVMGNQTCGVLISGTRYLVTFAEGSPVAVTVAP